MTGKTDKIVFGILALLLIGMFGVFITAFGQEETTKSQVLLKEITPDEARAIALKSVSGIIGEITVEQEDGVFFYEVEVKDGDLVKEVKVDFQGNLIDIETEGEDFQIAGSSLDRASQAALAYIGEGRVTDSETGDEEGYYEIEITLDNGNEVDVHLNENFEITSAEYD